MTFEHPGEIQTAQLIRLWKTVFGEYDGFWELFRDIAYLPDHCLCIAENGQVTAGLYWFDCSCGQDQIAYIYAVVTDPAHRGRGLCRTLMNNVHALLKNRGYASAMLVPADEALRVMYRKMGYEDCTSIGSFSCTRGETSVPVRNVGVEEYAARRRKLLPEDAVIQEGIQLPFLAAQARLLAGENFLLAAYPEKNKLHGVELLGDPDAAPGILKALGCETGTFQIPGTEKPLAMIYKLTGNAVTPGYFGFSFD